MIPLAAPNMGAMEKEYASRALDDNRPRSGEYVEIFERAVAEACNRGWCIATVNGTAALHLAMSFLGYGNEKLVHIPQYTYPAAAKVAHSLMSGTVENDPTLDYDCAEIRLMNDDGKVDWPYIVDAAPAVGTDLKAVGTVACLSFNGNKTITTGQGGAIVGDDTWLEKELRSKLTPSHGGLMNYPMANINAAIGCAQMDRLTEFLERKHQIYDIYEESGLPMVDQSEKCKSKWLSMVSANTSCVSMLRDEGIEARLMWPDAVALPSSTNLTEADQQKVIEACEKFLS